MLHLLKSLSLSFVDRRRLNEGGGAQENVVGGVYQMFAAMSEMKTKTKS